MREFLQLYGVILLFAVPCGTLALAAAPIDRHLPAVAGMPASTFGMTLVAFAVLGYAVYRHRTR